MKDGAGERGDSYSYSSAYSISYSYLLPLISYLLFLATDSLSEGGGSIDFADQDNDYVGGKRGSVADALTLGSMYVCVYVCMYVRMYVRMYVCMYVFLSVRQCAR
jgi:hypothetical protein